MSKICLISDIHSHNWSAHSTVLPSGRNSRFQVTLDILDQLKQHCLTHGIKLVIFGGDLFEVKKIINVPIFNDTFNKFYEFHEAGIRLMLLVGNHDHASRSGEQHALEPFKKFATVMDEMKWYYDEPTGLGICAVPYTEDFEAAEKMLATPPNQDCKHIISFTHQIIEGAQVGVNDYQPKHYVPIRAYTKQPFMFNFAGHLHIPHNLSNNIVYVGSPNPMFWGDPVIPNRGFIEADLVARTYRRVGVKAPQFLTFKVAELEAHQTELEGNFVRIVSDTALTSAASEQIQAFVKKHKVASLQIEEKAQPKYDQPRRTALDPSMHHTEMVEKYIHAVAKDTDGYDLDYLKQIGLNLIQTTKQQKL